MNCPCGCGKTLQDFSDTKPSHFGPDKESLYSHLFDAYVGENDDMIDVIISQWHTIDRLEKNGSKPL